MTLRAAVFDLDGLLVDSEPYWRDGFRASADFVADTVGLRPREYSDRDLVEYEGGRASDTVQKLALELVPDADHALLTDAVVDEAVQVALTTAADRYRAVPKPIDDAVETLRALHATGVRIAVASSSAEVFIRAALESLGVDDLVEVVESAFELDEPKPHPQVYLNALHALGVDPTEAVALEDSWTGVQSALRAGIATVWRSSEDPSDLGRKVDALMVQHPDMSVRQPLVVRSVDAATVLDFVGGGRHG